METSEGNHGPVDFAQSIVTEWMDAEYQVSLEALRNRNWTALPVADFLGPTEAEWLAEAIGEQGQTKILGICFQYKSMPTLCEIGGVSRDALIKFNTENSYQYVIMTDEKCKWLYFKHEANKYFLLCGPLSFLQRAYRRGYGTAEMLFMEAAKGEWNNDTEREFFRKIWGKYASLKSGKG